MMRTQDLTAGSKPSQRSLNSGTVPISLAKGGLPALKGCVVRSRLILSLVVVAAALGVTMGVAAGASVVRCGHLYQPACQPPHIILPAVSATCHRTGTVLHLPAVTITSSAGLRTITVTVAGRKKPIAVYKNLNSPTRKTIRGLTVNTHGLSPGEHRIVIKAVDSRGKSSTETLFLAICKIKPPPFTG